MEELEALVSKAAEGAVEIPCKSGRYKRWTSDQGAELWIQIDRNNRLVGVTPYFRGESELLVRITAGVERLDDTELEGAVHGWADPQGNDPEDGAYPFVFDLVDKGLHERFAFPFISPVQLSAFAHELNVYESDEEFMLSQDTGMKYASESFVPSGLFQPDQNSLQPYAIFSGHILKAKELSNPLTNQAYHWMLVRTLGGVIDVVSDPELVLKPPVIGGVVKGEFWLCGRILEPKYSKKRGLRDRLFRKPA